MWSLGYVLPWPGEASSFLPPLTTYLKVAVKGFGQGASVTQGLLQGQRVPGTCSVTVSAVVNTAVSDRKGTEAVGLMAELALLGTDATFPPCPPASLSLPACLWRHSF